MNGRRDFALYLVSPLNGELSPDSQELSTNGANGSLTEITFGHRVKWRVTEERKHLGAETKSLERPIRGACRHRYRPTL